jgi:hypothetical protein
MLLHTLGILVRLAQRVITSSIAAHRPGKIQQPQPNYTFQKGLETASPGNDQLLRIKGVDGLLNPKVGLLLDVFQIP